ncbi:MAG: hypothetical protein ABI877_10335, partial [Gemmatimonadaceae bacterium]
MIGYNFPAHKVRLFTPTTVITSFVVTLALFSTACSDPASPINAPISTQSLSIVGTPNAAPNFVLIANAALTCTNGSIDGSVGTFAAAPTGSI